MDGRAGTPGAPPPTAPGTRPLSTGSRRRRTFPHAAGELALVTSAGFVLHHPVALRLSHYKLSRVGVTWGGDEEGKRTSGTELSPGSPAE